MSGTGRFLDRLKRREGQTAVEYAMILAGVAVVAAASFNGLGNSVNGAVNQTVAMLSGNTASSGGSGGSGSGGSGSGGDGGHHDGGGDGGDH